MFEHLKFSPREMARESEKMRAFAGALSDLTDSAESVMAGLDLQLKNHPGLMQKFREALRGLAEERSDCYALATDLETISEIYACAEQEALRINEALPTGFTDMGGYAGYSASHAAVHYPSVTVGLVPNPDLVVEEWLMALVFREDREDQA